MLSPFPYSDPMLRPHASSESAPVCPSTCAPSVSAGHGLCPHPSKLRLSLTCFFGGSLSSHLTERASPRYLPRRARSMLKGVPRGNGGTGTHTVTRVPRPAGNTQDLEPAFRTFQLRSLSLEWALVRFDFLLVLESRLSSSG